MSVNASAPIYPRLLIDGFVQGLVEAISFVWNQVLFAMARGREHIPDIADLVGCGQK